MDTSHQRSATNYTDEWYTPPEIFQKLGHFDLDPCAPVKPLWKIAKTEYTALDDGLFKEWHGRVWRDAAVSCLLLVLTMPNFSKSLEFRAITYN